MLYIVTALKSEAQAFVDRYKLTKSKLQSFTTFSNNEMILIVSHIGVVNARKATQALINQYDITDDDTYLNIGICGASKNYAIGDLLEVGCVTYDGMEYSFRTVATTITCVDEEISEATYEVVDMESYGFYDAVIHNPAIKTFHILKVVSDHFEPHTVTKEKTKALIFKTLNKINKIITSKDN